jgi:hypothetical protein
MSIIEEAAAAGGLFFGLEGWLSCRSTMKYLPPSSVGLDSYSPGRGSSGLMCINLQRDP